MIGHEVSIILQTAISKKRGFAYLSKMLCFSNVMSSIDLPQLSFQEWKYLDAYLVWIYEGEPRPSGKKRAWTDYVTAWHMVEGGVTVDLDGVRISARKGEWLVLPSGESYRDFSMNARLLSLHFNARWVTGQSLFRLDKALVLEPSFTRGWLRLCRPMLRMVRRSYPDAYNELPRVSATFDQHSSLQGAFQSWLGRVIVALHAYGVEIFLPQTKDSRVLLMIRWLDALSLQKAFRLHEMSSLFGLSQTQVNRLFCAEFGITPKRYFESRRLQFARAALVSTGQAVKEISYKAGFRHQSEFTAWFKKHTGKSPTAYRAQEAGIK